MWKTRHGQKLGPVTPDAAMDWLHICERMLVLQSMEMRNFSSAECGKAAVISGMFRT